MLKILAKRLKKLREEKKVSQKKVANLLNITQSAYAMYERKNRNPGPESLIFLANYFNVSTDYLLGLTDERYKVEDVKKQLVNSNINIDLLNKLEDKRDLVEILNLIKDLEEEKIVNIKKIIELTLNFSK